MARPLLLSGGDGMLGGWQGRGGMEETHLMTMMTIIVVGHSQAVVKHCWLPCR